MSFPTPLPDFDPNTSTELYKATSQSKAKVYIDSQTARNEDLIRLGKMVSSFERALKLKNDKSDRIPDYELLHNKNPTPDVQIISSYGKKTILANWTSAKMGLDEGSDGNGNVEYTVMLDSNFDMNFDDSTEFLLITGDSRPNKSLKSDKNSQKFLIFKKSVNSSKIEAFYLYQTGAERHPSYDLDISQFPIDLQPRWGLLNISEQVAKILFNGARLYEVEEDTQVIPQVSKGPWSSAKVILTPTTVGGRQRLFTLNISNLDRSSIESVMRTIFKVFNDNINYDNATASEIEEYLKKKVHPVSELTPFTSGKEGDTLFFHTFDRSGQYYRMTPANKSGSIDDYQAEFPISSLKDNRHVCRITVDKEKAVAHLNDLPSLFFKRLPEREVLSLIHDFVIGNVFWRTSSFTKLKSHLFEDPIHHNLLHLNDDAENPNGWGQLQISRQVPLDWSCYNLIKLTANEYEFYGDRKPIYKNIKKIQRTANVTTSSGDLLVPLNDISATINPFAIKLFTEFTPIMTLSDNDFLIRKWNEEGLNLNIPKVLVALVSTYLKGLR